MSTTASDGTPDGLSDWTDIVHNVAQYNPHLSLLSLNSSDELFKRPYKNFDNRRRTSTSSRNSTPDSSRSFKHPGSFVNCFNNRSSTSDLSINSSISCSPSKFYHTEQLIASYASSYGGSPSNSSSWIPRKRMRYADLSDSNTSNIVDENDFDMSGVCRFTSTPSPRINDYFYPRATSTPFVSPPDPRFLHKPEVTTFCSLKQPNFRSEDEEAVHYLITKYLTPNLHEDMIL